MKYKNKKDQHVLFTLEERKEKKWPLVINCPSTIIRRHTRIKRMQWHFKLYNERLGLATERHCMHRLKEAGASHALVCEEDAPTSFLNKKIIIQLKKIIIPLMNVTPNIAMTYKK